MIAEMLIGLLLFITLWSATNNRDYAKDGGAGEV